MSWFPRPSSPRAALNDLVAVMRHSSREQRIGAALALLVTTIIVVEFIIDDKFGMDVPEQPAYVQLYAPNRTEADIIADQKKDQGKLEAARKEQQRQFQKLGNQLGID